MIVVLRMIALEVPPVHFCFSVLSRAALKVELGLERSYRRAPRGAADGKREDGMAGICHFCLAGMAGREWEDV